MYQDFILHCLQETSSLAMKNFGKVKSMSKTEDNNQVLTQTDLQIGNLLVTKIKKQFPKHNIIDEETGGVYTDFIGNKVDYSNPVTKAGKNFTVCTAPPQLHQKLQKIIKKHGFKD